MKAVKTKIGFSVIVILLANFLMFKIAVKREVNMKSIPVAKETIYPRTKIKKEDLDYLEVPEVFVNDLMIIDETEIINMYSDIQTTIPKHSVFYKESLFKEADLPDYPSILLKDNQVVYTINTDLVKMSGNSIVVGQKIDLYTTLSIRNEKPLVDLLVSSVRVVGIKDKKGFDINHPDSSKIPFIVLIALDKDIMPLIRACDEISTMELYAHSNIDENVESSLNEGAKIFEHINID